MSDMATSALPGATYQGFVTVAEAGLRGMITLRGDLSALAGTVKKSHGLRGPGATAGGTSGRHSRGMDVTG